MDGAMDDHLAVVGEWSPIEVPAPRDRGRDLHVGSLPELAQPIDEFSGAIDPYVARRPRIGRYQVVDDERDPEISGRHVAKLPYLSGVHAADVEARPVELVAHRHHVRLAVRRRGGDPAKPLGL